MATQSRLWFRRPADSPRGPARRPRLAWLLFPALALAAALQNASPAAQVRSCNEAELRAALATGEEVVLECRGLIELSRALEIPPGPGITVRGEGVTLRARGGTRLIEVPTNAFAHLVGLTLSGGSHRLGGALWVDHASLTLENCVVSGNLAARTFDELGSPEGGAIYARKSTLTLIGTRFESNRCAGGTSGALHVDALGGAVSAHESRVAIRDCTFLDNRAEGGIALIPFGNAHGAASGGAIFVTNSYLKVASTEFTRNLALVPPTSTLDPIAGAHARGGGLAVFGTVPPLFTDCLFFGNVGAGSNGGRNGGHGSAFGGALFVDAAQCVARSTTFISNRVVGGGGGLARAGDARGGALSAGGSAVLEACDFLGNEAHAGLGCSCGLQGIPANGDALGGAAAFSKSATLSQCSFISNRTSSFRTTHPNVVPLPGRSLGGAVFAGNGVTVVASTFLANTSEAQRSTSGAVDLEGAAGGAALYLAGPFAALGHLTVASNVSPALLSTPSGAVSFATDTATNRLLASLFSGNLPASLSGPCLDLGWNLSSAPEPRWTSPTSRSDLPAGLAAPARAHTAGVFVPLLPESPALGAVPPGVSPSTDQLGFPRPTGPTAEIGAVEHVPAPTLTRSTLGSWEIAFTVNPDSPQALQQSSDLASWETIARATSDATGLVRFSLPTESQPGSRFFRHAPPHLIPERSLESTP